MLTHKNISSVKLFFSAALIFLSLGTSANGTVFGAQGKYAQLVMGGIGSTLTLTPAKAANITGGFTRDPINSAPGTRWLDYAVTTNGATIQKLVLTVCMDPDTATREGFLVVETNQGVDTIYVTQPGTRCISPKQNNSGTEFYMGFMRNFEPVQLFLYATTDHKSATVKIYSNHDNKLIQSITISQNQVKQVYYKTGSDAQLSIPPSAYNSAIETVTNNSFRIVSDSGISLYAYNARASSSEISYIIPKAALGDEYFYVSQIDPRSRPDDLLLVATENNTLVTITPSAVTSGNKVANDPFTIRLQQGQTYLMSAKNNLPGFTGTHVKSSRPVAFFSGNYCANVGLNQNCYYCDHMFEQLIPLRAWGKRYALALTDIGSNIYRIVAAYNNTNVTITEKSGVKNITLNRGESMAYRLVNTSSSYAYIEADNVVQVGLLAEGATCIAAPIPGPDLGDPFLLALGPIDRQLFSATFTPIKLIATGAHHHAMTVIVETAYRDQTKLEWMTKGFENPWPLGAWVEMEGTPYSYAITKLDYNENYNYHLSNPYGFTAYAYGYGWCEAYGYLMGVQLGEKLEEAGNLLSDFSMCAGNTSPLPLCIDGTLSCELVGGETPDELRAKEANRYYWYNDLTEWNDDNPLAGTPIFNTGVAGNHTFFVSKAGRCGVLYPQQINVEVKPLPDVTFENDTVCVSTPADYDYGGRPAGGTYTFVDGKNQVTTFSHKLAGIGTHDVTYTYTDPKSRCPRSVKAKITVESLARGPFIRIAKGDTLLCEGDRVTLQVGGVTSHAFQWLYKDPVKNIVDSIRDSKSDSYEVAPNAAVYKAGRYIARVTNSKGCTVEVGAEVKLTQNPDKPNIVQEGTASFCVGGSYKFYDNLYVAYNKTYMSYQWYRNSLDYKINGENEYEYEVVNETNPGPLSYILGAQLLQPKVTPAKGCWSYDTVNITVYEAAETPTILGATTQHFCYGDSLMLTAAAQNDEGYAYRWYYKNSYNQVIKLPLSGRQIYVEEGVYLVESASKYGCLSNGKSSEVTVAYRYKPGTPNITPPVITPVCEGGVINITATALGASPSYQWYFYDPLAIPSKAYTKIEGADQSSYGVRESGHYAALAAITYPADNLTCSSPYSTPKEVTLWPKPLPPNITGKSDVCIGNTNIVLSASPAPNSAPVEKYQWYENGYQLTAAVSDTLRITRARGTYVYSVKAISANECASDFSTQSVTVWNPDVSILGAATRDTCFGNVITLKTAVSDVGLGSSYEWYKDGKLEYGANHDSYAVSGSSSGTQSAAYHLYVTNQWGCKSTQSNTVTVSIHITSYSLSITSRDTCAGNDLKLTATELGAGSYQWFFEDKNGNLIDIGTTSDHTFTLTNATPSGSGWYTVRIRNVNGCVSEGRGNAVVYPLPPQPEITPDALHICSGDSTRLLVSTTITPAACTWTFTGGDGRKTPLSSALKQVYAKQTGSYTAQVRSDVGCWSPESKVVAIETHRKPERPVVTPHDNPIAVCASGSTTLTAFAAGATSYQWYAVDPGDIPTKIPLATSKDYAVKESGRYAAQAYILHSAPQLTCPSDSMSIPKEAMIFPVPPAPMIATDKPSACSGDTVTLRAILDPADRATVASYRWYKNDVPRYATASDTCFVTQIEDATYTVVAISSKACTSPVSTAQKVSIRQPSVSIADTLKPICHGGTVTLTANTNTGANSSYEWYENGVRIPNASAISYMVRSEGSPTTDKIAKYHVYVTDYGKCRSASPSNTVTVSIYGLPSTPVVPNPPPVCESSSVTLTASPSGEGMYRWFFEKNGVPEPLGVASNDTSCRLPNIQASSAGKYTVQITNRWGCTSQGQGEVVVYASPQNPLLNIDDAVHLCTGDSVLLTAYTAGGDHYEWYFGSGKLPATGDRIYAKMPGTYSVWSVSNRSCRSRGSDAVAVSIHPRPEVPAILPDGRISVCANSSTTITGFASGATSYQWYSVDTTSGTLNLISGATGSSYAVGQSGSYAVRADILHSGSGYRLTCPSTSLPKEVELFPLLLPPVISGEKTGTGEKTSGCDGETLTLTAAVPGNPKVASYKWYKNNVEMSGATSSTYTVSQVEVAQYKAEALSSKGCRSEASTPKEVAIRHRPSVSIADGVREVCGGTITLAAVTNPPSPEIGGSYEWYENAVYMPGASTSPSYVVQGNANALEGKKASCYLFVTDRYGCRSAAASNTVEVNIRELPPNPVATTTPPNGVCENSNATLKVSPAGAGVYTWFKRNGRSFDSIATTSDAGYRVLEAQMADAGQYAVEITNTYGCKSAVRGETDLNVLGLPIVNILETRACEHWTAEHTVNFAEPEGGLFTGWGCTPDGKFVPADVHQGEAVVSYTYTGPNGCTNRDTKIIEVIRLPNTPIVSAEGPTEVCEDSVSVTLKANVAVIPGYEYAGSYSYQWRKDGFAIAGEDAIAYVATKEGAYDVRVCNRGLCWAANPSAPVTVLVKPKPAPPAIATQSAFICPDGSTTELFVQNSEPGSFQWYKGNSKEMKKIINEIAPSCNAGEVGQYAVMLFGENGCWSTLSNLITVGEHPMPKLPEIVPSQANLYASLDYALTVKAPQASEMYGWYKNNLSLDVANITYPIYSLDDSDTGAYTVKAVNEHGCQIWSEPYALVWADAQLFIPNVFTPNGDGVNDYFQIIGLEDFVENKLEIVNKRGTVVFSQKNYHNGWNGDGLPNDIYYYTLVLKRENGATSNLRGFVHLKQ